MESERNLFLGPRQSKEDSKKEVFRALRGNEFSFDCHKEIGCFTACCAKLRLILTPYDILRMKNRLGLPSGDFLDRYTETLFEDQGPFPMVKLKMREDEKETCPFVTKEGCTIYEDRPVACRLYPLGRASSVVDGEKDAREKFFLVNESHCLGFQEKRRWTIEAWLNHEGVKEYNAMNDPWLHIITSRKSLGPQEYATKKLQMFFMASYNIDKFREFVFQSRFLECFEVSSDLREKIARDDVALVKFGFDWLEFSLFGEKTLRVRTHSLQS